MKRQQRANPRKGTQGRKTSKETEKARGAMVKAQKKAEMAMEEWKQEAEGGVPTVEEAAEWASFWSGVDEEMSWATSWCPFWEMEATGVAYYALFADVLWDYDIWDLRTIDSVPNPCEAH